MIVASNATFIPIFQCTGRFRRECGKVLLLLCSPRWEVVLLDSDLLDGCPIIEVFASTVAVSLDADLMCLESRPYNVRVDGSPVIPRYDFYGFVEGDPLVLLRCHGYSPCLSAMRTFIPSTSPTKCSSSLFQ
jgi:hypothetical protein